MRKKGREGDNWERRVGEDRPVVAVVLKSSLMIFSSMSSSSWEEEWDTEREAGCSRNVCCRNVYTIYTCTCARKINEYMNNCHHVCIV